jgi:hypothetical protein
VEQERILRWLEYAILIAAELNAELINFEEECQMHF